MAIFLGGYNILYQKLLGPVGDLLRNFLPRPAATKKSKESSDERGLRKVRLYEKLEVFRQDMCDRVKLNSHYFHM